MMSEVVNMSFAIPELFLLTMACIILLVVAFFKQSGAKLAYILSQITMVTAALLVYFAIAGDEGLAFSDSYIKDGLSNILKIAIFLINTAVLMYSTSYLKARDLFKGEYYVLAVFATLGMSVMVSAHHFLTLYLGLELMSLCLYAMVAMHRDSKTATEAAMKYFILGALASGMLLYGMSIVYGATGSLALSTIASAIQVGDLNNTVLSFGLVFIVIGVAFKLGAVPFHMWLPDVYEGAPTAMTLFIATTPKLAAFAMMIRLLVEGLGELQPYWQDMLIMLAVLSITLGNVVAIAQTNLKRMLAYSTISHVGFILLGVISGTGSGYAGSLFYALTYTLMTLAAFGIIILMSRRGFEAEEIDDYKGLSKKQPWYALMTLIVMFSMAGIPPLVGFYAKLAVIKSIVDVGLLSVAVWVVLMSVIGAFYYLRVIKVMYFDSVTEEHEVDAPADMQLMISTNAIAILALGIFPGSLMALCVSVFL
jgi:NADH-quinone oxidoreductase subunit N|tara:strand:- start:2309 stop:3745 length:1437 start_codon:yes stop_codon:yes gene_type:complete